MNISMVVLILYLVEIEKKSFFTKTTKTSECKRITPAFPVKVVCSRYNPFLLLHVYETK